MLFAAEGPRNAQYPVVSLVGVFAGSTFAVGVRELRLRSVLFKNPRRYAQLRSLQSIATEWSRVFPHIRRIPCPGDVYGPEVHIEQDPLSDPLSREPDRDDEGWSTDDHSRMLLDDPGLDFDEYGSGFFRMRRRLWKLLGYEWSDCYEAVAGTKHMWQTDREIETFDWPIIPARAFVDPKSHSRVEEAEVLDLTTFSA